MKRRLADIGFTTILTNPQVLHDLIVEREPDRVVIEICSIAGWVSDLVRALGIELQVANPNDERWQWRKVKTKNDRADALKLAQLSALNQVRLVHVPQSDIRQWRALITYRQHLVQRRTKIKNHIRDLLLREGQLLPRLSGIAPVIERSGKSTWIRWRYFCPKFMRQSFHEFAAESVRHSFWARAFYEQQIAKGKNHQAATRALAYKWIRIIWKCWQTNTPYNEVHYLESLRKKGSSLLAFAAPKPKTS